MAACSWTKPLALAALLSALIVGWAGYAQSPRGSISIRLTDFHSKPLEGVAVTLHNRTTGAIERSAAAKGAVYRFVALEPGDYTLEAASPRLGNGELDDIAVVAGHESHIRAAMELRPVLLQPTFAGAAISQQIPALGVQAAGPNQSIASSELGLGASATSSFTEPTPVLVPSPPTHPADVAAIADVHPTFAIPVGIFPSARFSSALGGACVARMAVRIGTAALQTALLSASPFIDAALTNSAQSSLQCCRPFNCSRFHWLAAIGKALRAKLRKKRRGTRKDRIHAFQSLQDSSMVQTRG